MYSWCARSGARTPPWPEPPTGAAAVTWACRSGPPAAPSPWTPTARRDSEAAPVLGRRLGLNRPRAPRVRGRAHLIAGCPGQILARRSCDRFQAQTVPDSRTAIVGRGFSPRHGARLSFHAQGDLPGEWDRPIWVPCDRGMGICHKRGSGQSLKRRGRGSLRPGNRRSDRFGVMDCAPERSVVDH
jgi:hypothetical protein